MNDKLRNIEEKLNEALVENTIDISEVNDIFNDATQWEHTAQDAAEAADILGVEESDIFTRCIAEVYAYVTKPHNEGGDSIIRIYENYADPGSDDYVYSMTISSAQ